MKRTIYVFSALGLILLALLVAYNGAGDVLGTLRTAGWALLWLVPLHLVPVALDSLGWYVLLRPPQAGRPYFVWVAAVRNAVSANIPLVGAAATIIGARLLVLRGVDPIDATASVIAEGTATLASELLFITFGVALFASTLGDGHMLITIAPVLAVASVLLAVIIVLQLHGGTFKYLNRITDRLARNPRFAGLAGGPHRLHEALQRMYAQKFVLLQCMFWQLAGLLSGAVELWVTLWLLHEPRSFLFALLLQCLGRAARNIAFMIPAGLGVQEAVYTLVGQIVGLPAPVSLALSLATRVRDLIFGLPVMAAWQWREGGHLLRSTPRDQST